MANQLKSTFPNMFIVLTVICLISAAALGFTYSQTTDRIESLKAQERAEAIRQVLPEFDNNPAEEEFSPEEYPRLTMYPATENDNRVGTAVRSYSEQGYSGTIWIMVGFNADGVITGTAVLEHQETPGLGAKMTGEAFRNQFDGFDPAEQELEVTKDGGDVDAITAATVTSRAFCDAVKRAYEALQEEGAEDGST
ncbi:MAG: RnfABCDGE type electron transport complex subunit G [Alkalispirochaetaceae bacterium]